MNKVVGPILYGEVMAGDVRVIGQPHPLRQERIEVRVPCGMTVRETLAWAAKDCETKLPRRFIVMIGEEPIPEEMFDRVRVKAGATVVYRATVQGGGAAGGGSILRSLMMILVSVAALFLAPILAPILFPGLAFGSQLIAAAITIGGALLVNALFPVRPPKLESDERKQTYSISGAKNTANPWGSIPVVLGRHKISPLYGAKPYTEIVGDDQWLRMLFVWGMGPLDIEDMRIGDTPIGKYEINLATDVQTRLGRSLNETTTLYPREVWEEPLSIELKFNEANTRFTTADIDYVILDFSAPNGVVMISKKHGTKDYLQINWTIKYRQVGTTVWNGPLSFNFVGNKYDTLRKGVTVDTPGRGQWEFVVTRISPAASDALKEAYEIQDTIYWTAIRGVRVQHPVQFKYPVALTALRIKATGQLNGTLDTLNGMVYSRCKAYNGSVWNDDQRTSNPADLFRYALQHPSNRRPVADALIDLAQLQTWWWYCHTRNPPLEFNHVRERQESVYHTLQDIAAAGRAVIIFKDGKWSVAFDEDPNALPVVQHFSTRNSWNFNASRKYTHRPHGFRVRFINANNKYQEDERLVFDDGYSAANATLYESIEFTGITNPTLIHQFARFHIAQARLRPETYEITTDVENLVCLRGDRVRVTHDVPLWGLGSGRIAQIIDKGTIRLDETIYIPADQYQYVMRFRLNDGSSVVYNVMSRGEGTIFLLDNVARLEEGVLVMIGRSNLESTVLRVLAIQPSSDLTATLTLVDDAPEITAAGNDAQIPAFNSNISLPVDPLTQAPIRVDVTEFQYAIGDRVTSGVRISWQVVRQGAAASYEVVWRNDGIPGAGFERLGVVAAPQTATEALDVTPGVYTIGVRALFADGTASNFTYASGVALYGIMAPPGDVGGFDIQSIGDISILTWDTVDQVNVDHYEIRSSPLLTGVTWGAASVIVADARGNNATVSTRIGTFMIKAVSKQGVYSLNPAILTTEVASLFNVNVVQDLVESPGFAGATQGVEVVNGALQLGTGQKIDQWTTLDAVPQMYLGTANSVGQAGTYTFTNSLDLGAVYTSRCTPTVDAYGTSLGNTMDQWTTLAAVDALAYADPGSWNVEVQVRTTQVNPTLNTWSAWERLTASDIKARAFQFRALLTGDATGLVTPVVRALSVRVDMPDRVDAGNNVIAGNSTEITNGKRITFVPAFRSLTGIALAISDRVTGDREEVTARDETGFTVRFFNSAGTAVARHFDWVAKGYGRKLD